MHNLVKTHPDPDHLAPPILSSSVTPFLLDWNLLPLSLHAWALPLLYEADI